MIGNCDQHGRLWSRFIVASPVIHWWISSLMSSFIVFFSASNRPTWPIFDNDRPTREFYLPKTANMEGFSIKIGQQWHFFDQKRPTIGQHGRFFDYNRPRSNLTTTPNDLAMSVATPENALKIDPPHTLQHVHTRCVKGRFSKAFSAVATDVTETFGIPELQELFHKLAMIE